MLEYKVKEENWEMINKIMKKIGLFTFSVTASTVNGVEGGVTLPQTGGVGTILFIVVGLVLIGGAISFALIAKRRRGRGQRD